MASVFIRVQTLGALYFVAVPPAPKLRNAETGEVATHRDSGEALFTVSLVETVDGRAQVIKVTVPESGVPKNLSIGAVVHPKALVAIPWARIFNGDQLSEGVTYRADAIESAGAAK